MDIEYHKVGYGNAYLKIDQAKGIRYDYIMKKHPMICAEAKHIGCQIQECQRKKRYAAEIRYPVTSYPEDTEECIGGCSQGEKHRNELQQNDDRLIQSFSS